MINFIRIITLMSLCGLFRQTGARNMNLVLFIFGRFFEVLLLPFRGRKYRAGNLGEALKNFFQYAGPIYIKLGQNLSTRPDIVGEEIASSLQKLQDKLPAFPFDEAKEIIESELKNSLDEFFDEFIKEPVAAASIAQVYRGRLKTGEEVAIKLLRPGIHKLYKRDISFLKFCANFSRFVFSDHKRLKPREVIGLLEKVMKQELDLQIEAANASELAECAKGDDWLVIPKVFWQYSTKNLMASSWVEGVSIYDKEAIKNQGLNVEEISQKIAVIFFNQAYRTGFFHADLHPGNIMVTKDGKIALVDFGIMGRLPEKDRLAVSEILYCFINKKYMRIAEIHEEAGYIPKGSDLELFALRSRIIGQMIVGMEVKDISVAKTLEELFKITKEFGMEVQHQLLLLQKTTIVVEGIGRLLNPRLNIWKLAEPWIKKWAAKNISPEAKVIRIVKNEINRIFKEIF